ncbi:MAG: aconitase X catalytic domain-containing protein [Candidatus Micrarchaeia archaeon]
MLLSKQEQMTYEGETGEAARQSMEILVALGKIYGAEKMISVSSAQIAGVSYKTIGDAGLEYLQEMARNGAKVRIPSLLNPAGMDRTQWKKMKVPEDFAKKQIEVLNAYSAMGITMSCTCTPYLIGLRPKKGEHIAWSESSAVAFSNSVLGARTNREGGPSALAAAICGVTPEYGYHLDQNRVSDFAVDVRVELKTNADFGAMGYYVGEIVKNRNPSFTGMRNPGEDRLKALGAAMAASGSVALFYAKGATPEFVVSEKPEKLEFTEKELKETKEKLNSNEKPDLITIGCPHASINEIKEVAGLVKGKKLGCDLWVCTAGQTKALADKSGYTKTIEEAGGTVVADTCMVVCPLEQMGYKVTGCNSGKAAKYLSSLCKQKVVFGDVGDIICR